MKIKFIPQNIEVDINPNKSVMNLALENGIQIHSVCKGVPSCAECRVRVVEGDNFVSKPTKAELNLIGTSYYIDGRRLSCQVKCFGPVTIDTTEQIERQDNPAKKIRGFKSQKQYESKAVLDTMLLTETPPAVEDVKSSEMDPSSSSQSRESREQNRNQRPNQQQGRGASNRKQDNERSNRNQQGRGQQNQSHQNRGQQDRGGQGRGPQDRNQQGGRGGNQSRGSQARGSERRNEASKERSQAHAKSEVNQNINSEKVNANNSKGNSGGQNQS